MRLGARLVLRKNLRDCRLRIFFFKDRVLCVYTKRRDVVKSTPSWISKKFTQPIGTVAAAAAAAAYHKIYFNWI